METSKKSSLCAVLLLIVASNVTYCMDQPKTGWKNRAKWVITVGEVALGLKPATTLMAQKKTTPSDFSVALPTLEPKEFTDLPTDIQKKIFGILIAEENASSLKEAAQTINSLAQVNKELNSLFNDPKYCLQLIKHLAKKYAVLDFQAAEALQIQASKARLILQKKLATACRNGRTTSEDINQLCQQEGADVNFTLPIYYPNDAITPLMIAVEANKKSILKSLFENGADVNIANKDGKTALMLAASEGITDILEEFLNPIYREKLNVNQQDKNGNTALMLSLNTKYMNFSPLSISYLLELNIDPELGNNTGLTPLETAKNRADQEVIDLILKAIDKKHGTAQ